MRKLFTPGNKLLASMCSLLFLTSQAQTIMFDDFTYSSVDDPALSSFNKWNIVSGASGPPEGAIYSRDNIKFVNDPANPANKLMTLSTTVTTQPNGTRATTHSRIETGGFEYFEGTYASRVYLSDEAFNSGDGNIQTFFTIVSSALAQDGSKYSELDIIEYMASDKWGVSPNQRVGYVTSYHKYIANPWKPWKTYNTVQRSLQGWHTFVATCTDNVNVRYYMDGVLLFTHSVTDNETEAGLPVYPRSNMHIAFANWIWNNVLGSSTANRTNTFQADWVLHYKDQSLSTAQVDNLVADYRSQGLQRRNLQGQTYYTTVNPAPSVQLTGPSNGASFTAPASITMTANATDANGTVTKVDFFVGNSTTPIGTDATAPYSFVWNNVAAGTYSITARATDNGGATATTPAVSITVTSAPIPQTPYGGIAWAIPGTVDAENYDLGGQGVAFNEVTPANEGGAYRTDPVDVEITTGGGYNVGYVVTDEWLEYTVNVTSGGAYNIEARVATTAVGKTFRLELDGATLGNFSLPNTTGWQIWQTASLNNVNLTTGQKILRIYATSGDFNLDRLVFTKVAVNQAPSVSLTAPTNGATFTAPATINITANASDPDGAATIANVAFYNGSSTTPLGTDNTAPYSFSWANVAAGTYTITARVTDNGGLTATSSAVTLTVTTPINQTPSVSLTAPTNGATFTAPATINITANASDPDGAATIANVAFYNGSSTTPLATDNTAPYSFSWTNVAAGTYTITARVTDNGGLTATSSAVTVTVTTPSTQSPYGGTAWAIPGTVEAENYDLGGQGIAFNELVATNQGGAYRTDAVDIEITTGGGYNIGYVNTDEWLEYTVNVATTGAYKIDARVATTAAGKTFRVELDGATLGNFTLPNTTGWQIWQTVSLSGINLTAGQKVLRIYATSTDFNLDKLVFTNVTVPSQTPYGGTAWAIPGTVEAENYDIGGQGIAFNETTAANEGGAYRTDAVDLETNPAGGHNLGYIVTGEWTEYTVNVTSAGTYTIDARVAAITTGKYFLLQLDGATIATVNVPNTGAWQTWQSAVISNVTLSAGTKVLRIYGSTTDFNVDKISFTKVGAIASADALPQAEINNAPNPFYELTSFTLDVMKDGNASVKVYDKNGMVVATVFEGYLEAGIYEYTLDATRLRPDVYYVRFVSAGGVVTKTISKL